MEEKRGSIGRYSVSKGVVFIKGVPGDINSITKLLVINILSLVIKKLAKKFKYKVATYL